MQSVYVENIIINVALVAQDTFTFQIDLDRIAIAVRIRNILFYNDGTNNNLYFMTSNLIKGKRLAVFSESKIGIALDYTFRELNLFYRSGQYIFNIFDASGNAAALTGNLLLNLEFEYQPNI